MVGGGDDLAVEDDIVERGGGNGVLGQSIGWSGGERGLQHVQRGGVQSAGWITVDRTRARLRLYHSRKCTRGDYTRTTAEMSNGLNVEPIRAMAERARDNVERVIVGKRETIDLLLVALLCEGHVLLEDVPGIGKTMLAKSVARTLDCSFRRIQFTPDLLPSDVTGVAFFNQRRWPGLGAAADGD
jgi:hypothetical protein